MDVGVAVAAFLPHVGEHGFGVAVCAPDGLVHPSQREAGLVVIEFRDVANGLPSTQRVAVLAGNIEWTVGAARVCVRAPLRAAGGHHQPKYEVNQKR
jgi:hypothetical protein